VIDTRWMLFEEDSILFVSLCVTHVGALVNNFEPIDYSACPITAHTGGKKPSYGLFQIRRSPCRPAVWIISLGRYRGGGVIFGNQPVVAVWEVLPDRHDDDPQDGMEQPRDEECPAPRGKDTSLGGLFKVKGLSF